MEAWTRAIARLPRSSMPTAVLLLLLTGFVAGADPDCSHGIAHGDTCCAAECGRCGFSGCGKLPGGAVGCCSSKIAESGRSCATNDPPCIMGGKPGPSSPHAELTIGGVVGTLSKEYISFTLDSSQWRSYDLSGRDNGESHGYGATLDVLVRGLQPAHLRVGGTQQDFDVYAGFGAGSASCSQLPPPMTDYRCQTVSPEQFVGLLNFTARNGLTLVYGLNDLFGRPTKQSPEPQMCTSDGCPPRNQSNIEALLRWTAAQPHAGAVYALELGNELNKCLNGQAGAEAQAADLHALRSVVDAAWAKVPGQAPHVIGPDSHSDVEFHGEETLDWFATFAKAAPVAAALTFHEYSLGNGRELDPAELDEVFLNPAKLDKSGQGADNLQRALRSAGYTGGAPLWAGETAAANGGGRSGITDTFIDSFWYLDQLGSLAARNVSVFLRQSLLASEGYPMIELVEQEGTRSGWYVTPFPLPDYFVAVLHKRLMGSRVLNATSNVPSLRLYAHCGNSGGVAVSFVNLARFPVTLSLPPPLAYSPMVNYTLTPGQPIQDAASPLQSKSVRLNGKTLALQSMNGTAVPALPTLDGQRSTVGALVLLPGRSLGFLDFPSSPWAPCTIAGASGGKAGVMSA